MCVLFSTRILWRKKNTKKSGRQEISNRCKDIFYSLKKNWELSLVDFKADPGKCASKCGDNKFVSLCNTNRYKLIAIIRFELSDPFFRIFVFVYRYPSWILFKSYAWGSTRIAHTHNNIIANDLLIKHFLNMPHMIHILMTWFPIFLLFVFFSLAYMLFYCICNEFKMKNAAKLRRRRARYIYHILQMNERDWENATISMQINSYGFRLIPNFFFHLKVFRANLDLDLALSSVKIVLSWKKLMK